MAITPTYCATKAAIHSYSQSLRYQLRSTKLQVIEIIPPYVRTGLMGAGQAADERAMPLDDFINETMAIIKSQDGVAETIVERVKLRCDLAEQNGPGKYSAFFKQFNEAMMAPHLALMRLASGQHRQSPYIASQRGGSFVSKVIVITGASSGFECARGSRSQPSRASSGICRHAGDLRGATRPRWQTLLRVRQRICLRDLRWVEMDVASQESVEDAIRKILAEKRWSGCCCPQCRPYGLRSGWRRSHQSSLPNFTMSTF